MIPQPVRLPDTPTPLPGPGRADLDGPAPRERPAGGRELLRRAAALLGRVPPVAALALLAYAGGLALRWWYVIAVHHPRHFVGSDAVPMLSLAQLLVELPHGQRYFHTIWPPGASAVFALSLLSDPSLGTAALLQLGLSALSPLLIGHAARMAFGPRAGWLALMLAALHLGFIHYGGFFLAEHLFQSAVTVALWCSVAALRVLHSRWRLLGASASGLAWGLAFAFRPNALPVALFTGTCLAVFWLWRRRKRDLIPLAVGLAALLMVVAPLAHRCSSLVGQFCPGASNFAMNVALGHAPDTAGIMFRPGPGRYQAMGPADWYPPARLHHGYLGVTEVPVSMYDTGGLLGWLKQRLMEAPFEFVVATVGNALDLFGSAYWPDDFVGLTVRQVIVWKQVVFFLIVVPGLVAWVLHLRNLAGRRPLDDQALLLTSLVTGVIVLAALSMGEPRYRIPFDGALILLAVSLWTRSDRTAAARGPIGPGEPGRLVPALLAAGVTVLVLATGLIVGTAHPAVGLAQRLRGSVPSLPADTADRRALAHLAGPSVAGDRWDKPGNHVFRCEPDCRPLRVTMPGVQKARRLEIATDHNDRYQLVFQRGDQVVGQVAWQPRPGRPGMVLNRRTVPLSAVLAGYDTIWIRPLYGDSRYSIGRLTLLP